MNQQTHSVSAFADSKNHYEILDGLRGIAAVMVVLFHILETFTGGNHYTQIINHGYLAVDFFFLLSGYVIGYAYDDRWGKMTIGDFFKRRLIRLHPMIIFGMVVGAIFFYFGESPIVFPKIGETPVSQMLLIMLIGFTLIPVPTSMDIRGWTEMHPLNGPAWSLFFEYVANILYALFIRRFSNTLLAVLVFISGVVLIHWGVTGPSGDVIGGWSLDPLQLRIGFTRLMFPFFAGLLLSRISKPGKINNAFLWSGLLLILMMSFPRIGGEVDHWKNGLYDSLSIILVFPVIVWIGASGKLSEGIVSKLCKFLGDISYPIYIVHYPIIYVYTAWVVDNNVSMVNSIWASFAVLFGSIALAYLGLRLYDIPVRKWLTRKFIVK